MGGITTAFGTGFAGLGLGAGIRGGLGGIAILLSARGVSVRSRSISSSRSIIPIEEFDAPGCGTEEEAPLLAPSSCSLLRGGTLGPTVLCSDPSDGTGSVWGGGEPLEIGGVLGLGGGTGGGGAGFFFAGTAGSLNSAPA